MFVNGGGGRGHSGEMIARSIEDKPRPLKLRERAGCASQQVRPFVPPFHLRKYSPDPFPRDPFPRGLTLRLRPCSPSSPTISSSGKGVAPCVTRKTEEMPMKESEFQEATPFSHPMNTKAPLKPSALTPRRMRSGWRKLRRYSFRS